MSDDVLKKILDQANKVAEHESERLRTAVEAVKVIDEATLNLLGQFVSQPFTPSDRVTMAVHFLDLQKARKVIMDDIAPLLKDL